MPNDLQVIDDEKKTKELEAKKQGRPPPNQSPMFDAPYPEGVRKDKIAGPDDVSGSGEVSDSLEDIVGKRLPLISF